MHESIHSQRTTGEGAWRGSKSQKLRRRSASVCETSASVGFDSSALASSAPLHLNQEAGFTF
jgi:hypothetical protein